MYSSTEPINHELQVNICSHCILVNQTTKLNVFVAPSYIISYHNIIYLSEVYIFVHHYHAISYIMKTCYHAPPYTILHHSSYHYSTY